MQSEKNGGHKCIRYYVEDGFVDYWFPGKVKEPIRLLEGQVATTIYLQKYMASYFRIP
jgi:hypothetical protein